MNNEEKPLTVLLFRPFWTVNQKSKAVTPQPFLLWQKMMNSKKMEKYPFCHFERSEKSLK